MKQFILGVLSLSALFAGCEKAENLPAENQRAVALLKCVANRYDSTVLYYDKSGMLSYIAMYDLEKYRSNYIRPVLEGDRVTGVLYGLNAGTMTDKLLTCDYNDAGKLVKISFYRASSNNIYKTDSLVYGSNGLLSVMYQSQITTGTTMSAYRKILFDWNEKGNISLEQQIRIENNTPTADTTWRSFTYDDNDRVNYLHMQPVLFLIDPENAATMLSANNMVSIVKFTNAYMVTSSASYTYDNNHPVTQQLYEADYVNGNYSGKLMNNRISYIFK